MSTEPGPNSLESPARQLQELRQQTKKLFFTIGDQVHIVHRGRPKNGFIKNYDGRARRPYEVMFHDGEIAWFVVSKLSSGNITGAKHTNTIKQPSLIIKVCDPPIQLVFD